MRNVIGVRKVLKAERKIDLRITEDLTGTALRPPFLQRWITAVDWQIKSKAELALKLRDCEAGHVRRLRIGDCMPEPLDQARSLKYLSCECDRGGVVTRHEGKAPPGMQSRNDAARG